MVCPPLRELARSLCGSGHAREAGDAMDGTGYAGVRGRARSHMGCAGLKAGDVHAGGGLWSGPCCQYLHDPLAKRPCVAKSLLSTGRYLASKQAASPVGDCPALSGCAVAQKIIARLTRSLYEQT
ncbi:hypothetical protein CXG45_22790 [Pseudomonas plecoglossicida]|uniref:Uncharacterized protein n=1 Tax=Pseudomonas plecoglossicida TaxID=70775 RepID=A0ABX4TZR2_PSEDL|nr:hypothetical protein CXG44_18255 [Pseudomonas plecoglossicida]PLU90518.1 hypothetical protein CXG45_22790 [Pseudomonas plecoglossicida]PLV00103.1 hypothetical protein CXG48_22795 [Pseudomonas plecoglossicida]PLV11676.1 hypothetical protein CXG47_21400 [Pseudomonas plecoglossicida]